MSKRGTMPISYPSDVQAQKLFRILSERFKNGTPSHTYGAYVLSVLSAKFAVLSHVPQS